MSVSAHNSVDLEDAEDVAVLAEAQTPLTHVSDVLRDEVADVRAMLAGLADAPQHDLTAAKERLLKRVPAPPLHA
jgi:signal transduction histidine kinase